MTQEELPLFRQLKNSWVCFELGAPVVEAAVMEAAVMEAAVIQAVVVVDAPSQVHGGAAEVQAVGALHALALLEASVLQWY